MPQGSKPILDFSLSRVVEYMNASQELPFVLLGIGPMSPLVIRTAIEAARDTGSPAMIIASRNQVESEELGGGYVDTTSHFVRNLLSVAEEAGFGGLLYICRDHGGPWQRNDEKTVEEGEAWQRALASYIADIRAGFNVLHIDPTLSKKGAPAPPLRKVIADTVRLIQHCEKEAGEREISYEVGTEATAGKPMEPRDFEEFISVLLSGLGERGLAKPCLIVGQTGTLVRMDRNVGTVDAPTASELARMARRHGLGFKEHNADYLPDFMLAHHRRWGITSANVAPEFGVFETRALLHLADMERELVRGGKLAAGEASRFHDVITEKVIASNRWQKWLYPDAAATSAEQVRKSPSLARHIVEVNGHYVFADEEVTKCRQAMLANMAGAGVLEETPEETVRESVMSSITRYIDLFNLRGSTEAILRKRGQTPFPSNGDFT